MNAGLIIWLYFLIALVLSLIIAILGAYNDIDGFYDLDMVDLLAMTLLFPGVLLYFIVKISFRFIRKQI